jgi:hypothetical protein
MDRVCHSDKLSELTNSWADSGGVRKTNPILGVLYWLVGYLLPNYDTFVANEYKEESERVLCKQRSICWESACR